MTTVKTKRYNGGHYPVFLRDAFLEAVEVYQNWNSEDPEPTVEVYTHHQVVQMLVSKIFRKLWNCTDIMPALHFDGLEYSNIYPKTRTYAAAARALLEHYRQEEAKAKKFERSEIHETVGYDS